jgi:wobble nucleotide-excising tRNase
MSTPPRPRFVISAKCLGPVFSLEGELTKNAQNLIFARNGTGKSFLARAFRYLDLYGQGNDIKDAARNLVSDESSDGRGEIRFSRGPHSMGELQLAKDGDDVRAQLSNTILHVFSEDFVHDELRQRMYEIDGEIENEISVDSENFKLRDAQEALAKAIQAEQDAFNALEKQLENEKVSELSGKAGISKHLREYRYLELPRLIERFTENPEPPEKSFAELLRDLDSLRSLPLEPAHPGSVNLVGAGDIDFGAMAESISRITSPSSVSETAKQKIEAHHNFFKAGITIVEEEHLTTCPFCEQDITIPDPKAIIDSYVAYFADAEEKHRSQLREFNNSLAAKESEIGLIEMNLVRQKSRFDGLKRYLPSKKDTDLNGGEELIRHARQAISSHMDVIQAKAQSLAVVQSLPVDNLIDAIAVLNETIQANNVKSDELTAAVEKADEERKALHRSACVAFEREFAIRLWSEFESLETLRDQAKTKRDELSALERLNPSAKARDRVAGTFELLLREFFGEKYLFDKENFRIKRGNREMARGPHRTLSEGEKTVIAFCYFVASIHRKVSANSDYQRLFLVFDDPVTSMSYDFVFAIAQTLKNLSISRQGEVSINPGQIDGHNYARPELLILTHSSYFFNISLTNRVVTDQAAFALYQEGDKHTLARLDAYVAPFQQQLRDVYETAHGREPHHGTGNAVRSVLEAVGRFCRPDKATSLTKFINFLAGEVGISLKSVLINSLCHGTYYEETPPPDDLKLACEETILVVEKYAPGQLEIIRSPAET